MVTTVSTDQVQELEPQQTNSYSETMQWLYRVPCAGVRYYGYCPSPSPAEDADPWSLQDILVAPDVDQDNK